MIALTIGEIRKRIGSMIGWGIGMFLFGFLIVFIFPQLAPQFENFNLEDIAFYQAFGDFSDFGTLKGFLSVYISSNFLLFLIAFAIIVSSAILVGEEDAGTLELLMTHGVKRWQIIVAKWIALADSLMVVLLALGAGFGVGYLLIQDQVEESMTFIELLMSSVSMWPVLMVIGTLTMLLGAWLPSRRPTWIVATIFVVYTFLINNLAGQNEMIKAVQPVSPFYYYQDGLKNAIDINNVLILVGTSLVLLLLTILAFNRRDVTVGAWPWTKLLAKFSR